MILHEWFKCCLHSIGENVFLYGIHFGRLDGALIAANVGVYDRLFKAHARWKSKTAKDMYITLSLKHQLQVTRGLGLGPHDTCAQHHFWKVQEGLQIP